MRKHDPIWMACCLSIILSGSVCAVPVDLIVVPIEGTDTYRLFLDADPVVPPEVGEIRAGIASFRIDMHGVHSVANLAPRTTVFQDGEPVVVAFVDRSGDDVLPLTASQNLSSPTSVIYSIGVFDLFLDGHFEFLIEAPVEVARIGIPDLSEFAITDVEVEVFTDVLSLETMPANVNIRIIPEPGAAALMMGAAGVCLSRRRAGARSV